MNTTLYVGNLPYSTTGDQLSELFSGAGEVTRATIVTDRETGRARGFGFVEMADEAAAQKAVDTFNGHEMDGRALVVNEARPREDR
jgi:cold-inducible RNA-binding protein